MGKYVDYSAQLFMGFSFTSKGYKYNSRYAGPELRNLKGWLSPVLLAPRIEKLQCDRWPETCTWALDSAPIDQWNSSGTSSTIPSGGNGSRCWWIHGKPGSGKSVLSAYLYGWIRELVVSHNKTVNRANPCYGPTAQSCQLGVPPSHWAVLYFTFQGNQELTSVISTLIHQLLVQHPDNEDLMAAATSSQTTNPELSPSVAINLLKTLLGRLSLT
jgi:hypothetical protein